MYFLERHKLENDTLEKAVNLYREYYSVKGIYENKMYEGIPELLNYLIDRNKQLYIVTGKPLVYLKEILRYFGLEKYFINLYGSGSGIINNSKEELIFKMLKENKPISAAGNDGDTKFDILGQRVNKIDCSNTAMER
jgi:phosphoglycolate phosphatase